METFQGNEESPTLVRKPVLLIQREPYWASEEVSSLYLFVIRETFLCSAQNDCDRCVMNPVSGKIATPADFRIFGHEE